MTPVFAYMHRLTWLEFFFENHNLHAIHYKKWQNYVGSSVGLLLGENEWIE